jgi:hypothetical protein
MNSTNKAILILLGTVIFSCNNQKETSEFDKLKKNIVAEKEISGGLYEASNAQGLKILYTKSISTEGDTTYDCKMDSFIDIKHPLNNPSISYISSNSPMKMRVSTFELAKLSNDDLRRMKENHDAEMKKFPSDQLEYFNQILDINDNLYNTEEERQDELLKLVKYSKNINDWIFQLKEKELDGIIGNWVDFEAFNTPFRYWVSNTVHEAYDMTLGDENLELKQNQIISNFSNYVVNDWFKISGTIEGDEYGFGLALENPSKLQVNQIELFQKN